MAALAQMEHEIKRERVTTPSANAEKPEMTLVADPQVTDSQIRSASV